MSPQQCEPSPSESVTALKLTVTVPSVVCQPSCPSVEGPKQVLGDLAEWLSAPTPLHPSRC